MTAAVTDTAALPARPALPIPASIEEVQGLLRDQDYISDRHLLAQELMVTGRRYEYAAQP